MRGAYYVVTALFIVTSSQIAAKSGHPLQTFDRDVITAGKAVVKSLPNRFLRGSRDDHNDLATEERSIYDALASMINEGVKKLPCAAQIITKSPRIGKAMKKKPRVGEAAKKRQPPPLVVEEVLYAAEAMKEMESAKKYRLLKQAAESADEALKKHWNPPPQTTLHGNPFRDISGNVILSLPEWKTDFGVKSMVVLPEHKDNIERVYQAFVNLCDENMKPTRAETSYLWRILGWKIKKNSKNSHWQHLEHQAQRSVLLDLREIKKDEPVWKQWENLPDPLKFGVLNYLLNLQFQRWVRMFNIFKRSRPDQNGAPLNLELNSGGNRGPSSAMALHAHSNVPSLYTSEPLNGASTSKSDYAVVTKRLKRTFNDDTDTASLPSKELKRQSSESFMPLSMELTTSGDHPVSAKKSRSSFGGPSSAMALHAHSNVPSLYPSEPLNGASTSKSDYAVVTKRLKRTFNDDTDTASLSSKILKRQSSESFMPLSMELTTSGDHPVSAKRSRSSFGGPSSAFAPYKPGDHSVFKNTRDSTLAVPAVRLPRISQATAPSLKKTQ